MYKNRDKKRITRRERGVCLYHTTNAAYNASVACAHVALPKACPEYVKMPAMSPCHASARAMPMLYEVLCMRMLPSVHNIDQLQRTRLHQTIMVAAVREPGSATSAIRRELRSEMRLARACAMFCFVFCAPCRAAMRGRERNVCWDALRVANSRLR